MYPVGRSKCVACSLPQHDKLRCLSWVQNSEVESHSRRVRSTPLNGHRQFDWVASTNIGRQVGRAGIYQMRIRANATPASCSDGANAHPTCPTASCFIYRARVCAGPNAFPCAKGSNTRSTSRFRALVTPIRANMVGPPRSATSMSASIAAPWGMCRNGDRDTLDNPPA